MYKAWGIGHSVVQAGGAPLEAWLLFSAAPGVLC